MGFDKKVMFFILERPSYKRDVCDVIATSRPFHRIFTSLIKELPQSQSSRSRRGDWLWSRHPLPVCRKPTHTVLRAEPLEFVSFLSLF